MDLINANRGTDHVQQEVNKATCKRSIGYAVFQTEVSSNWLRSQLSTSQVLPRSEGL